MKHSLRGSARILVVALILLCSADLASARGRLARGHRPPPKPVYTAISAVDSSGMTITTAPKNSTGTTTKTYKFNAQTKITVNGNPGTTADLKPGQRIRVGLGANDDVAEELAVTTPPPGADKHKGAHKHPR